MKRRQKRGSARTIGAPKRCAVVIRGGGVCVWCTTRLLSKSDTTIDHLNGNHFDNAPDNILPACRGCNSSRAWGATYLARRLSRLGTTLEQAQERVAAQIAAPLDRLAGLELAEEQYPGRRARERQARERWEARNR